MSDNCFFLVTASSCFGRIIEDMMVFIECALLIETIFLMQEMAMNGHLESEKTGALVLE